MIERPTCSIEGCSSLARGSGYKVSGDRSYSKLCDKHHRRKYNMPYDKKQRLKRKVSKGKCIFCEWTGPTDLHRLKMGKDGGKYTKDNVIEVCPNCHRLIHLQLLKLA